MGSQYQLKQQFAVTKHAVDVEVELADLDLHKQQWSRQAHDKRFSLKQVPYNVSYNIFSFEM